MFKMNSIVKKLLKIIFIRLPFSVQTLLVRGNPEAAFYIKKTGKTVCIDYFLGKYKLEIDVNVDLQRRMLSGSYETGTMSVLRKLIKNEDICLDVGANVGAISFALADLSGPNGQVHSFEPGPVFLSRLRKNLSMNPSLQSHVYIHDIGLSDRKEELAWQASDVYTGTASMDKALHLPHLETFYLKVFPLDEYEPIQKLPRVNFIKVDVDGLELSVFKGAIETLKKHRPKLYFETTLWNEEQKESAKAIESLLKGLGYSLYKASEPDFELVPATFPDLGSNTIALPNP